jgi:hypothetical protein
MDCFETRQFIQKITFGDSPSGAFRKHLAVCELCRERYTDALLEAELGHDEGPEPREGFVDEAIGNAIAAGDKHRRWPLALAATVAAFGIALSILFGATREGASPGAALEVALAPQQEKLVRVLIDSVEDRDEATLTIELAENLELDGFPDTQVVRFNTGLRQGNNLLALPLTLTDASDSHFEVRLSYGSTRNRLQVRVNALDPRSIETSL